MKRLSSGRWILALLAAFLAVPVLAAPRMTDFNPTKDGFAFANDFTNDVVDEFDIKTDGLCGGMVYTALDFYLAGKPIPRQDYRPADQTRLHDYIYNREVDALKADADKWAELGFNPFGSRNSEFFHWGLQGFNGGRLQELRASLDRGMPVPLGLWHYGGFSGGEHYVLAIGYDMGRYRGDLGQHQGDLKIYVYDPNYPNEVKVLQPDMRRGGFGYRGTNTLWLTYFVDTRYRRHKPPVPETPVRATAPSPRPHAAKQKDKAISAAMIAAAAARMHPTLMLGKVAPAPLQTDKLIVMIATGADDLRRGSEVNLTIRVNGSQPIRRLNVNKSRHWIGNYSQTMPVYLGHKIALDKLVDLSLDTHFAGGLFGDNWNVNELRVEAVTSKGRVLLYDKSGSPLVRFTGKRHRYVASFPRH